MEQLATFERGVTPVLSGSGHHISRLRAAKLVGRNVDLRGDTDGTPTIAVDRSASTSERDKDGRACSHTARVPPRRRTARPPEDPSLLVSRHASACRVTAITRRAGRCRAFGARARRRDATSRHADGATAPAPNPRRPTAILPPDPVSLPGYNKFSSGRIPPSPTLGTLSAIDLNTGTMRADSLVLS